MRKHILLATAVISAFCLSTTVSCKQTNATEEFKITEDQPIAQENAIDEDISNLATELINGNEGNGEVVTVTENNFSSVTAKGVVLIDFFATWCGPCKMQKTVLAEVAKEYAGQITIGTLDVDKSRSISNQYGISSIPCMILFKDGKEIKRIIGYHEKAELLDELAGYITVKVAKSDVVTVDENNFNKVTAKGLVLVDFFATWCGPCKKQKPILAEVASEYKGKITIATLDTDKCPNLSNKFGISSIPCMILFKDGKEVKRIIGLHEKPLLLQELSGYLK